MNRIRRRCISLAVLVFAFGATLSGQDQSDTTDFVPLAPPIPSRRIEVETLILREIPFGETVGRPVRIARLGHGGDLESPRALDLPEAGGRAFTVYPFDWLRVGEREVEIRERGTFRPLLTLAEDAQVYIVSEDQIELLTGELAWLRDDADAPDVTVTADSVAVRGRGRGEISRRDGNLEIVVDRGRFEWYRNGNVAGIVGAGQRREIRLAADGDGGDGDGGNDGVTTEAYEITDGVRGLASLRDALNTATRRLHDGALTGEHLATLWEVVRVVGSDYAARETRTDADVVDPDIVFRDIAQALRLLSEHAFSPPPGRGM